MKHSRSILILGWIGTFLIFISYGLNILGFIESSSLVYALGNLIGALFLGIRVAADRNWANWYLKYFLLQLLSLRLLNIFGFSDFAN